MGLRISLPQRLVRTAQVLILAGLVILIWKSVDWQASVTSLANADWRWLGAAALALTLQTVLSALRWRVTASRLGIVISVREAVREYYLSQVVNQSLPGGLLGDAGRAVRARAQAGLLASGQAVVFERLAGQMGLLAVLIGGIIVALLMPQVVAWPMWLVLPTAGIFAALVCLPLAVVIALRVSGRSDTAIHRFYHSFAHAVLGRDVRIRQTTLSLGTALLNVAAFAFCARAIDVSLPVLSIPILVPLILFAMVIPLSISGWGLREGAAAALFPVVGATMSEGLATSIAFGLVFLATVLPGALVVWLHPNGRDLARRGAIYEKARRS